MWQKYSHMWCWYDTMWELYHKMWEKIREPPNMTKVQSCVMLVLRHMRMVSSNVRKKKETTECDKSTVIYDVNTTQCKDGTIKYEKKINEPPNMTKI